MLLKRLLSIFGKQIELSNLEYSRAYSDITRETPCFSTEALLAGWGSLGMLPRYFESCWYCATGPDMSFLYFWCADRKMNLEDHFHETLLGGPGASSPRKIL